MSWTKKVFGAIAACAILSTSSSAVAVGPNKCWSDWNGFCWCAYLNVCGTSGYTGCTGEEDDECDRNQW